MPPEPPPPRPAGCEITRSQAEAMRAAFEAVQRAVNAQQPKQEAKDGMQAQDP